MKEKITETSILLFEKKGFSQTSIQDIVDQLDVTKGTFYYYFSSKEQLLMDIHLDYITNLLERQKAIIEDDYLPEKQKLIKIIQLLIHDISDKGPSGRVFFREMRHLGKAHMTEIKVQREAFRKGIETIIRNGMERGEFKKNLRPDILAFGVLGVTNWSYNWYKPNGELTADELVEIFSDMLLEGIESTD